MLIVTNDGDKGLGGCLSDDMSTARSSLEFGNCQTTPLQVHSGQNINEDISALRKFYFGHKYLQSMFITGRVSCS